MISKLIDVARCAGVGSPTYRQVFRYEGSDEGATVATALRELNERPHLEDVEGVPAEPIRWQCSCLQRKCGSCAMLINEVPRLACDVRLSQLRAERVTLAPLRKFPLVADLVVDRQAVYDRLREVELWLDQEVELPSGRHGSRAFEASRCLECGCCLEVCPNFSTEGAFGGMATMVPFARVLEESEGQQRERLAASYRASVFAGCGKSLACRDICPAGIDIAQLMSRSNAVAVWRRR